MGLRRCEGIPWSQFGCGFMVLICMSSFNFTKTYQILLVKHFLKGNFCAFLVRYVSKILNLFGYNIVDLLCFKNREDDTFFMKAILK